jgi:hypothetical protein
MFGINMDSTAVYHYPGNYHGKVSTFGFTDGHCEPHRWRDTQINNPQPPPGDWHNHTGNPAAASCLSDLAWLKEHTTVRK